MSEWLKELIAAIGGGSVVLIGLLTIFKSIFLKLFESGIETSFEKNIEKYRNRLSRSTKAYEILLDKEFSYYSSLDPYLAKLVPLIQDLVYYTDFSQQMDEENRKTRYKEKMLEYLEMIPKIKNDVVLYQPYIPNNVFVEVTQLVKLSQDNMTFWHEVANKLFYKQDSSIDTIKAEQISESVLKQIGIIEMEIKRRLLQLSEQESHS